MKIISEIKELGVVAHFTQEDPLLYSIPVWKKGSTPLPPHFYKKMSITEFTIMMENLARENGYLAEFSRKGTIKYLEE